MAMPRPEGKALRIAKKVIPGLPSKNKTRKKLKKISDDFLSDVELRQTRAIQKNKSNPKK